MSKKATIIAVVNQKGLMPGAAFGLHLHSICFQEIKYFVFLKATS